MKQWLVLISFFALLLASPLAAQQVMPGLPAGVSAPAIEAFTSPAPVPAGTAAGTTVALSYFNPNPSNIFNWQVPRDFGSFINLMLMQRFTLPNNAAFLDSVSLWIEAVSTGSVRFRVYPDSVYDLSTASFRFPTFWQTIDEVIIDKAQMKLPGLVTIPFNGKLVPKNFFVSVEFTVANGTPNVVVVRGDSHQKPRRSLDDSRVVMVNQAGGDIQLMLLDSALIESQTKQPIYSNLFMTAFADTATSVPVPAFVSTANLKAYADYLYKYSARATGVPRPLYTIVSGPNGMTINQTTGVVSWTPTLAQVGSHPVTLRAANANGSAEQSFTVVVAAASAPKITSLANRTAIVLEPYFYSVTADGGPEPTFRLVSPPTGMSINAITGVINFTPALTQVGSFVCTVEATNPMGTDRQTWVLQIDASAKVPKITSAAKTTATVGVEYKYDVVCTGNPMPQFSLTQAPAGMTIHSVLGTITWTPTALGKFDVTVHATNRAGSTDQTFSIDVQAAGVPPVFTSTPVQTVLAGQVYSYTAVASGTPAPRYSLKMAPTGMQVDATSGLVTWSPARIDKGQYSITITATNDHGAVDQTYSLQVQATPRISSEPAYTGKIGVQYSYQVVTDAEPAATVALTESPTGMAISPTGLVTWTPVAGQVGQHTVKITATNAVGTDNQQFTIDVIDPTSVEDLARARGFALSQNFPNPVSIASGNAVSMTVTLPSTMQTRIDIRNILGQDVALITDTRLPAGTSTVSLPASIVRTLVPGMYLVRFQAADITLLRAMTVVR